MRTTSANIRLGAGWQGASPVGTSHTIVEISLDPGENPTGAEFVDQANRLLKRELSRPAGEQQIGRAVLEAAGLMQAAAAAERRGCDYECSKRTERRLMLRLRELVGRCVAVSQGEARSDALEFLKGVTAARGMAAA